MPAASAGDSSSGAGQAKAAENDVDVKSATAAEDTASTKAVNMC